MAHSGDWYLYVVECADGTLYAGIATDVARRIEEHNSSPKGARYTRSRRPVTLRASWPFADRSAASSAEWHFKRLTRRQKLARIREAQGG